MKERTFSRVRESELQARKKLNNDCFQGSLNQKDIQFLRTSIQLNVAGISYQLLISAKLLGLKQLFQLDLRPKVGNRLVEAGFGS